MSRKRSAEEDAPPSATQWFEIPNIFLDVVSFLSNAEAIAAICDMNSRLERYRVDPRAYRNCTFAYAIGMGRTACAPWWAAAATTVDVYGYTWYDSEGQTQVRFPHAETVYIHVEYIVRRRVPVPYVTPYLTPEVFPRVRHLVIYNYRDSADLFETLASLPTLQSIECYIHRESGDASTYEGLVPYGHAVRIRCLNAPSIATLDECACILPLVEELTFDEVLPTGLRAEPWVVPIERLPSLTSLVIRMRHGDVHLPDLSNTSIERLKLDDRASDGCRITCTKLPMQTLQHLSTGLGVELPDLAACVRLKTLMLDADRFVELHRGVLQGSSDVFWPDLEGIELYDNGIHSVNDHVATVLAYVQFPKLQWYRVLNDSFDPAADPDVTAKLEQIIDRFRDRIRGRPAPRCRSYTAPMPCCMVHWIRACIGTDVELGSERGV